jgi:hypothetical protein
MDGRDVLPRLSRPFAFSVDVQSDFNRENSASNDRMQTSGTAINEQKDATCRPGLIDSTGGVSYCRGFKFEQESDSMNTK